jgi:Methyltransferase domain
VDVVFLDGSHEYEAVRRDILAWMPRIKSGGMLAGHDINDHYPGVGRAVHELCPGAEVRPAAEEGGWGGCWVWRKP